VGKTTQLIASPLMTDLYQITMAYAEWKGKRSDNTCVFEAFFRKEPFKGRYAVFAGLDEVISFLENFKITEEHINYLQSQLSYMEKDFFIWL